MRQTYPESDLAFENLRANRLELGARLGIGESRHTPPASGHYPHIYFWDSLKAAIANARHNTQESVRYACTELYAVLEGQHENGFIANIQFAPKGRKFDPERWLAFGFRAKDSNYTQAPMLALTVREIYDSIDDVDDLPSAKEFLADVYPQTRKYYEYLINNRSNSQDDRLIGVIHPHETGRDSDPTFDFIKPWRLKRNGPDTPNIVDKLNVPIDYGSILLHGLKLRFARGDIAKQREKFWVNDVMMNCIYVDNLNEMATLAWELGEFDDAVRYASIADEVEERILSDMWFPEARDGKGAFYALDANKQPIKEVSVSNLFPLVLPKLKPEQLESLLDMMDSSFNTNFPLPSVATDSPNYDPHNRETDRLWRGPTWINVCWYIVERGLNRHINNPDMADNEDLLERCEDWAERIVDSCIKLVKQGSSEHYDPDTGEGQRPRVHNFAWNYLAFVMRAAKIKRSRQQAK